MVIQRRKSKISDKKQFDGGSYRIRQKESSFDETKHSLAEAERTAALSRTVKYDLVFWIGVGFSQFVGLLCIAVVAYWCHLYGGFAWASNATLQFNFHPLLMILGLIFFYGESILVYRVLHFLPKNILKLIHGALHLTAIIMASVGLAAVFENHRRTGTADMYSLHSWIGITTFGFFIVQYVMSFVTFLYPGLPGNVRAIFMPFHTFIGLLVFVLAVATAAIGINEKLIFGIRDYVLLVEKAVVGNCLGLLVILFGILVVSIATHSKYKRDPLPWDVPSPTN